MGPKGERRLVLGQERAAAERGAAPRVSREASRTARGGQTIVRWAGRWSETYGARQRTERQAGGEVTGSRPRLHSKRKEREVDKREEDQIEEEMREPPRNINHIVNECPISGGQS
jgi:hypothetical protein